MGALDEQHGGDHYKGRAMQPVELWAALNLNGFQASIVKYITRHKEKNGAQDIDKAEHFIDLAIETGAPLKLPEGVRDPRRNMVELNAYCSANELTDPEAACLILLLVHGNGDGAKLALNTVRSINGYPVKKWGIK